MSFLTLAHKLSLPYHIVSCGLSFQWFKNINKRGILSMALLFVFGVMLFGYFISLFLSLDFGFQIQTFSQELRKTAKSSQALELSLRQKEGIVGERYQELTSVMENISNVRYITPGRVVTSYAPAEL